MAGIFGLFDYAKEGPGVQKDEPDRGPVRGTLNILIRRLWELMKLNLMMILFNLPALVISCFAAAYMVSALFPSLSIESFVRYLQNTGITAAAGQALETIAATQLTLLYLIISVILVSTSLFVIGPFQAGFSYILRNYIRDEHVFVWSDFFEHAKANFRQSSLSSLISAVVMVILTVNYSFYNSQIDMLPSMARLMLRMLILLITVIWILMQQYIYPMMVTFNLTLPQIYRNSLSLVILRLPYNLLLLVLAALLTLVIPGALIYFGTSLTILIAIIWYLLFALSIFQFLSMAIVWRGVKKYLIKAEIQG